MEVGTLNGTATFNSAVTLDGAITLGAANKIIVGPDFTNGQTVIAAAGAMTDGNTTIEMRPANLTDGQTITVLDAGSGTTNATYTVIDTALFDYTAALDDGNDTVIVTANKRSTAAIASNLGIANGAADALDRGTTALSGAGDAALSRTLNALLVTGGANAKKAAEQMQVDPAAISSAGSAAVTSTGTQVISVGSARMASLRTGTAFASAQSSGFAAGEDVLSRAVWMKPFANWGDQDERKGIAGFENETFGMAFGGDVQIDRSTVGISFSYANTDVDSKGSGNAQNDIDSYQATLYADYTSDTWYVEGLVGYARNEISTSRTIDFANSTASADYGSNQFMLNLGGGMPIEVEKDHFFTPQASFQYTFVENETYSEEGAGSLNLRVDQDEIHVALANLGMRYHTNQITDSGTMTPEFRAGVTYDFAGDDGVSTNVFNGGGAAFDVTGADVVEFGYKVGAGFSFQPLDVAGLTISANYDLWAKEDFVSHNANASLRLNF
jgi:outer membrane autotransporter protein